MKTHKEEIPTSHAHRLLNPGGVVLVTSMGKSYPNIITLAWQSPVSHNPPLVMLSISPKRYSHELIQDSGEFVINVPPRDIVRQVHYCGSVSGRDVNKFQETELHPLSPGKVSPPLIKECIGHLECKLISCYEAGDHTLFIGQIILAMVERDRFDQYLMVDKGQAKTIHHLGDNLYSCLDRRVEVDFYRKVTW